VPVDSCPCRLDHTKSRVDHRRSNSLPVQHADLWAIAPITEHQTSEVNSFQRVLSIGHLFAVPHIYRGILDLGAKRDALLGDACKSVEVAPK
jgi:hypothetical protein